MGLPTFYKLKKGPRQEAEDATELPVSTSNTLQRVASEKAPVPPVRHEQDQTPFGLSVMSAIPSGPSSRPMSLSARSRTSSYRTNNTIFLDEIKHEVMVNYLYQQQCSRLWVSDGSGEIEGVLLRKARGQYMACPPQLVDSAFAAACTALNVRVCPSRSPA